MQIPDVLDIRRDSPTACREAINVLLAISASKGLEKLHFGVLVCSCHHLLLVRPKRVLFTQRVLFSVFHVGQVCS